MTMEVIKKTEAKPSVRSFPMKDMERGQVCYCLRDGCYVLRVCQLDSPDIILVLSNHCKVNAYHFSCKLLVRELYPGESITIKFS